MVDSWLRQTAAAMKEALRSRALNERFLISYDMNFYKNVAAQRMHNRAHQTNYTAGYILFVQNGAPLPASSVDYRAVLDMEPHEIRTCDGMHHYMTTTAENILGLAVFAQRRPETKGLMYSGGR